MRMVISIYEGRRGLGLVSPQCGACQLCSLGCPPLLAAFLEGPGTRSKVRGLLGALRVESVSERCTAEYPEACCNVCDGSLAACWVWGGCVLGVWVGGWWVRWRQPTVEGQVGDALRAWRMWSRLWTPVAAHRPVRPRDHATPSQSTAFCCCGELCTLLGRGGAPPVAALCRLWVGGECGVRLGGAAWHRWCPF